MLTTTTPTTAPGIREDVLRDPRYPVHKIADRLLPYLRLLVERFHPRHVILFGSYAYGEPNEHSDVDLLIVKEVEESPLRDKIQIRKAWWSMPRRDPLLPFDLILVSPERHGERLAGAAGFYDEIVRHGLVII
jgi:predicted nucleotidyltransferase